MKSDCVPYAGFQSVGQANAWADDWCLEGNAEVHRDTMAIPAERLKAEQPLLRALAGRPPLASGDARLVGKMENQRVLGVKLCQRIRRDHAEQSLSILGQPKGIDYEEYADLITKSAEIPSRTGTEVSSMSGM